METWGIKYIFPPAGGTAAPWGGRRETSLQKRKEGYQMTKLYIAYGSNMDEKQMAYRCPEAQLLGTAEVENYRLLFKGSKTGAYATIEPEVGCRVPVLVWRITEQDERSLDRYEGYPRFYYKKNLEILFEGERKTAMVYVMHEENPLGIPSQRYQEVISNAYRKFGFDSAILEKALADSSVQKR